MLQFETKLLQIGAAITVIIVLQNFRKQHKILYQNIFDSRR